MTASQRQRTSAEADSTRPFASVTIFVTCNYILIFLENQWNLFI